METRDVAASMIPTFSLQKIRLSSDWANLLLATDPQIALLTAAALRSSVGSSRQALTAVRVEWSTGTNSTHRVCWIGRPAPKNPKFWLLRD
jgi:hypothetical protein